MARSTLGRTVHWLALAVVVVALTVLFMKGFGLLQYVPGMDDLVYGTANALGINGDEDVEGCYIGVTGILSMLVALAIVALAYRGWARRRTGQAVKIA